MGLINQTLEKIDHLVLEIVEEHHVGCAQQVAKSLATSLGIPQVSTYSIVTAVSELASNLYLHTTNGGLLTLITLRSEDKLGLEIIAEDNGPGIPDIHLAMQDGFTTNGGLGGGLPGVKRLMDEFEITSTVGLGTRIVTRKWDQCK